MNKDEKTDNQQGNGVLPCVIHWVAITEKMPESGQCVLLYSKDGGVAEVRLLLSGWRLQGKLI